MVKNLKEKGRIKKNDTSFLFTRKEVDFMHEGNWGDIIAAIEEYKNNK